MRHFMNVIVLVFVACLFFIFLHNDKIKITQEVLDLFPHTADKQVIDIYQKFANSRYVLVAVRGFGRESRDNLQAFLQEIQTLPNVDSVMTRTTSSGALEGFLEENYLYTATPKSIDSVLTAKEIENRVMSGLKSFETQTLEEEKLDTGLIESQQNSDKKIEKVDSRADVSESNKADKSQKSVKEKVQNSKDNLQEIFQNNSQAKANKDTPYNFVFHPKDPLGLLTLQVPKPYIFVAKDYGYMAIVTMKDIKNESVKETLVSFMDIAKKYPNIRFFSQNFMSVTNLDLILNEVNFLLGFATIAFIVLYFVIIRIPLLTINTICTLIAANIVAILIVSSVYPKVTIMALSFGMGISNIAIDYMMHHNFFGLYVGRKREFNRPVFYGYITTIIGFSACLFIPFPLLAQLSLYAIISLTLCYVSFAFIYPCIGFSEPRLFLRLDKIRLQAVSSYWFLGIALCGFVVAFMYLRLDFDLSKLDYQNKPMLKERTFFTNAQGDTTQLLLSSDSIDGIIGLARDLQGLLYKNNATTFIPLSLMPTNKQEQANTTFIESKIVQQNKAELLKILPHLKARVLQIINNSDNALYNQMSPNDKVDVVNGLFEMFKDSYTLDSPPKLTLENLSSMGFSIVSIPSQIESKKPASHSSSDSLANHAVKSVPTEESSKTLKSSYTVESNHTRFYYLAIANNKDLPLIRSFAQNLDMQNMNASFAQESGNASIEARGLQDIMDHLTNTIYMPMLIVLCIALFLMICMLLITARKSFLDAVVFILFPLACSLCVIASHSDLNIMHLFALLILVVVSIDYGIYSVKEGNNPRTTHAIFFSVLTTGVSFGILIISKTKALNSFGEVVFVGMSCILLMLILQRPLHKPSE